MPEEITHAKQPIAVIPPQSLLAGDLYHLRQKRKRLSAEQSIRENEAQQKIVIAKLMAMGREDLTK